MPVLQGVFLFSLVVLIPLACYYLVAHLVGIADGVAIIFGLILLYIIARGLLYKRVDWSKPNVFVRPFLPPMGSEKPHRLTDQNELDRQETQED